MKITLFTLNMNFKDDSPDRKIDSPLHTICINTWDRVINYAKSKGYEVESKIYTMESPEYKFVYEQVLNRWEIKNKSHYADVFRHYIMSKYPNYLWLDWDVYIRDNFEMDFNTPVMGRNWFFMYNANDLESHKNIYETYVKHNFVQYLADNEMTEYFDSIGVYYEYSHINSDMIIHCSFLDNVKPSAIHFITDREEESIREYAKDKRNYRFVDPLGRNGKSIKGLHGEESLINYLLYDKGLSSFQKDTLLKIWNSREGVIDDH